MSDVLGWMTGILALALPGFGVEAGPQYNGYIEADYVYAAPAGTGRIATLPAIEGREVVAGSLLFSLESDSQSAALRAAEAREAVAEATWRNLETGSRQQEIDVIRAELAKALADQSLAVSTLERSRKLNAAGVSSTAKLDSDQAALESANAQVAQLKAQLAVAELPARDAQLVGARASLDAARADADRARADLADRLAFAPTDGLVERIYYKTGEVVAAGAPVVSLLPPGELKARFFIPEPDRMRFSLGDVLAVECDGCPAGLRAELTYMASDPQHTPPIIYSRDERARLVFMAEAQIIGDSRLLPGQPVTLTVPE